MSFVSKLVIISIVIGGLSYWWMANFNAPEGLEQRNEVLWIYGVVKVVKFLTEMGEKIGLGHRTALMRKLENLQFLESKKPRYDDIKIFRDSFSGVEVLIIEPKDKDPYGPALIWMHGGGWAINRADSELEFLEELSKAMNMMIVSIEYRLAPEHPYPIPLEDCFIASKYFIENAIEHNVDPFRIAVGGLSAGGNLAAALSMKIRDSNLTWKFKVQLLVVPCLQAYDFNTPSYLKNSHDEFLSRTDMANFWLWYAFGPDGHLLSDDFLEGRHLKVIDPNGKLSKFLDWNSIGIKSPSNTKVSLSSSPPSKELAERIYKREGVLTDPLFAPLLSNTLVGLPPALIITAEFDVLRDDGSMFAERLKQQEVDVKVIDYEGAFHYVLFTNSHYHLPKRVLKDIVDYLKARL